MDLMDILNTVKYVLIDICFFYQKNIVVFVTQIFKTRILMIFT